MLPSQAEAGLEAFPRRIFLVGQRPPVYDPEGFVLPLPRSEVLSAAELLSHTAVLVVAPPWTGKTFVAQQLYRALTANSPPGISFGEYVALSSFEIWRGAPIAPSWWQKWQDGGERACWLIDAIDEDLRQGGERIGGILARIAELSEEACSRLYLVLFARENEVPPEFLERLEDLLGRWSRERPDGLRRVRLAGLDREAARALVGEDRFQEVCQRIRQNGLTDLASLPAVLEHLRGAVDVSSHREEVWRGVLRDLLREWRGRERLPPSPEELEDRFEVVQRLAVLVTFNGARDLGFPARPGNLQIEDLLPKTLPDFRVLRGAAFEVFKTAVFERTESGGFRFAQDHVREWFAAFALKNLSLSRVQPLLTDDSGQPEPVHLGVLGTLARISVHKEVRDWIEETHGGVIPPPDADPWSLPEAVRALDRLQELARSSSWGLDLWREEKRLHHFALPGMGVEIAHRLDLPLPPVEQQLLLDIARAVGAREPLRPAVRLLRTEDARIRGLAAELLLQYGTEEELAPLASEARLALPTFFDVLTVLVPRFLQLGLWDFAAAADLALAHSNLLEAQWLQMSLAQDLALDSARGLIERYVLPSPRSLKEPLLGSALLALLRQERLASEDGEFLAPLLLDWEERVGIGFEGYLGELQRAFAREVTTRRALFLGGLRREERSLRGFPEWGFLLTEEDVEWLLDLVREREGQPVWLLELLYFRLRTLEHGARLRRQARREIHKWSPELIEKLDREWRRWESRERKRLQWSSERDRALDLETVVRQTLDDPELDLTKKMWRLSWSCFAVPGLRPSRVNGRFEDLPDDLRKEVLSLCGRAIDEVLPTPIPEGEHLPGTLHWEAACFHRMAGEETAFLLSGVAIRRWLPTLLAAWDRAWEPTLYRCFEVDRPATEDGLVEALRRDIQGDRGGALLGRVPPELWSEGLASRLVAEIVESEGHRAAVRIELLIRIARIFPDLAGEIASSWEDREGVAELREAGLDVLLAVAPEKGWPRVRERLEREDPARVLLRLPSLHRRQPGLKVDPAAWSGEPLGELAGWLFRTFPPSLDPPLPGAWEPSPEAELQSLGNRIPPLLFERGQAGDAVALETLARSQAEVRRWLDQARAQQGAQGVLSGVGRESSWLRGPSRTVPLPRLVRLLQDERYRILRTADDLQAVVLEELRALASDAKQHLALLYRPIDRERGGKRRHLHEEALQSYLCCRLRDRLLSGVLEPHSTTVLVDREPLAARNTRNDIKIQAVAQDDRPLTVIIEVKWSDHEDLSTAQVSQLAEQYLLENGLTHGIYLAGWCGEAHWKAGAWGEPPAERSAMKSWWEALDRQAQTLRAEYPALRVEPFLLDLTWQEPG